MILFAFLPLWGAIGAVVGAISIPVIIHLINRRRFKIVPWAAMKFLLAAQKQTRKRMRIEQLLLLVCRMAILAGTIFAMAAVMDYSEAAWTWLGLPELGRVARTNSQRTHHIIVLDASLSMSQKVQGDQTAFEVARQLALRKIADASSGDGYSVLVLKDSPTWLVGEASQDTRKVSREVENVKPSHGGASVQSAFNLIAAKLGEMDRRFPLQAVYFFTDMQGSTWQGTSGGELRTEAEAKEKKAYLEIQGKATTVFVDCGPQQNNPNVAITNLEFDLSTTNYVTTGKDYTLRVTVMNFAAEPKERVKAKLFVGKAKSAPGDAAMELRETKSSKFATIDPYKQQVIEIEEVRFDKPGTYALQVSIGDDALNEDNKRTIIITVRESIPVLLVNGKLAADRFETATGYLKLVLNPFKAGAEEPWAVLRPTVADLSEFRRKSEDDLDKYDCIFWCDVAGFKDDPDVKRIDAFVRRGGGFIVSLGGTSADKIADYNEFLFKGGHGLLPAELKKPIEAPPEHNFYLQNTDDAAFSTPPLNAFSDEKDRFTLRTARFRKFVQATVPEGKARTVLSFALEFTPNEKVKIDDSLPRNSPAIVEWSPPLSRAHQTPVKPGQRIERQALRYRGKVILLTSALNMDWSSWPASPSYGAMMHELTRYAVAGRLREQSTTVGGTLDGFLPGGAETDVNLKPPEGYDWVKAKKVRTQNLDDVNFFRWSETDFAGVYKAETAAGHEVPFAVNVPTGSTDQRGSESDLVRLDENKLRDGYLGWENLQFVRDPLRAMVSGGPSNADAIEVPLPVGPFIANVALLIVLGLLFLEIFLAWHFGHYTTTEGAVAQSTPSPLVTAIAAVVAGISVIVVALGAYVLIHENYTRDFLGMLPDLLRGWFESAMNMQPPDPGEGRNWDFQKQAFLFGLPGSEHWYAVLITAIAAVTIFFTYKAEAPKVSLTFKLLLGALRFCLILTTLWFLLPRGEIHYNRQGWPDLVILIDDTRSMGAADTFNDKAVIEKVKELSKGIRQQLEKEAPEKVAALTAEIAAKSGAADKDPEVAAEVNALKSRLAYWKDQDKDLKSGAWRPSRLQLVQAILAQDNPHWLKTLLTKHSTKVHIFHLDAQGKATKLRDLKGDAGDLVDKFDAKAVERAGAAIAALEPDGTDSRLGTAVRQVIDHYRGSSLSSVIMFTDGVTTRDETLAQVSDYAAQKGIALFFIGVGDQNEQKDLKLHDLFVEDPIYIGDTAVFDVRLTGHGFRDTSVKVLLEHKGKGDAKPKEVAAETVKIDPTGKSVKIRLRHKPKDIGPNPYIIRVEPPRLEPNEKPIPPQNLKLEKTIEVINMKQIKVLYVEGQPRYEFRYLKFLLERETDPRQKDDKKKSIELKVLLLEAEDEFHKTDETALRDFPPDLKALEQYDVLIMGDCDPKHVKLRNSLKDIAAYVRGEDLAGKKSSKPGGGFLLIAGSGYNPHSYKDTPLGAVMPIEPTQEKPPPDVPRESRYRPELTPSGKSHPIFRFGPDDAESSAIFNRLTPIYWHSSKYRLKPAAEVLAFHPNENAEFKDSNGTAKHPLVVYSTVGTGRSMFFGFDETWRWRLREDEPKYNNFWIQTMRYLSRGRSTRTDLRLDRQTPYRVGEPIKVTVTFPDGGGDTKQAGPKIDAKTKVEVEVVNVLTGAKELPLELKKIEGSRNVFEGTKETRKDGKFRFRLATPNVASSQPDNEQPSAEAIVELPPGELDRLRMDYAEMNKAASATNGGFFSLANANEVLEVIPQVQGPKFDSPVPPTRLWNQWWVLLIIVSLITSEWILRKMKHLL